MQHVESVAVVKPEQAAPPQDDAGLEHVRLLVRVTLPQVPDQPPMAHAVHAPFTAAKE